MTTIQTLRKTLEAVDVLLDARNQFDGRLLTRIDSLNRSALKQLGALEAEQRLRTTSHQPKDPIHGHLDPELQAHPSAG